MLRDRVSGFFTRLAVSRYRWVTYLVAGVLTAASAAAIPHLRILTARQGMVSNDIPVQADYEAYQKDFGTPNQLIVMLKGDPASLHAASDAVSAALLARTDRVRTVFHRVDLGAFRKRGLYYLPLDDLERFRAFLADDSARTDLLFAERNFPGILGYLEDSLSAASDQLVGGGFPEEFEKALGGWQGALEGKGDAALDLAGGLERQFGKRLLDQDMTDAQGYFVSRDRARAFLIVQPAQQSDDATVIIPFMNSVEEAATAAIASHPGVTAHYTGWPAFIEEDHTQLLTDLPRVSVLATVLILTIFVVAFRSLARTILVFVPLVLGVVWNLGLTVFTIGHLNFLSSVFVGILFGMGIDFGIYFIRRFDDERVAGCDEREAVRRTFLTVGQGIVTGGLSTTVAFLAIGFTDQPAFAELGIVAGTGVAAVLAATMLLLPPLLIQFPPSLKTVRKEAASPRMAAATRFLLRRPMPIFVVLAAVTAILAVRIPSIEFDFNLNNLLPTNSAALATLREMEKNSPFSDQFIAIVADNEDQVRRLQKVLPALDSVRRVESAAQAVPENPDEKKASLSRVREDLGPVGGRAAEPDSDLAALSARLDGLIGRLEAAEEDAFAAGRTDALKVVETLLPRFQAIRRLLDAPEAAAREKAFETSFFDQRDAIMDEVRRMAAAEPPTLETIDPRLKERFVGASGRQTVYVFPSAEIWDQEFLDRFVNDVRAVAAEVIGTDDPWRVTGFAVTYQVTGPLIRKGFNQASWAAGIVVVLMLLFDLRRPRPVLIALIPLIVTVAGLLGGMAWLGIKLNMATQIAFPILFGLGVAYGIHMVHRWIEPEAPDLPRVVGTTGNAVMLAALTTMAGFGALTMARHSALVSFGSILFVGILVSALAALFGLPVVLSALKIDHTLHRKR